MINGGFGNDGLFGGDGNDTLACGADADIAFGEAGNDGVFGGAGKERFRKELKFNGVSWVNLDDPLDDGVAEGDRFYV